MARSVKCPECGSVNAVPAAEERKISCGQCGMILVLRKLEVVEEAAAPAAEAKPAGKPRRPSLRSNRGKQREPSAAEEAAPAGRKTTRGGRRGTRAGHAAAEPEETAGRAGRRKPKKDLPVGLLLGSLAGVIVVGVVAFLALSKSDDENQDKPAGKQASEQAAVESGTERSDADQATSGVADTTGDERPAAVTEEKPATPGEAGAPKPKDEKPKRPEPKDELAPFQRPADVTEAQQAEVAKHIETLRDLEATRQIGKAQNALRDVPRAAIPFLINALAALDPASKDDVMRGQQMIAALELSAPLAPPVTETNAGDAWRAFPWPEDTETKQFRNEVLFRKTAVKHWWRWWNEVQADWKPDFDDEGF